MSRELSSELCSIERDLGILGLIEKLNALDDKRAARIQSLHDEIAELRDGMVALSNRIEAATRSAVTGGTLLHSVKVTEHRPRRVTRYCFECELPRQFTEGKCDHCATPLQAEAEPS